MESKVDSDSEKSKEMLNTALTLVKQLSTERQTLINRIQELERLLVQAQQENKDTEPIKSEGRIPTILLSDAEDSDGKSNDDAVHHQVNISVQADKDVSSSFSSFCVDRRTPAAVKRTAKPLNEPVRKKTTQADFAYVSEDGSDSDYGLSDGSSTSNEPDHEPISNTGPKVETSKKSCHPEVKPFTKEKKGKFSIKKSKKSLASGIEDYDNSEHEESCGSSINLSVPVSPKLCNGDHVEIQDNLAPSTTDEASDANKSSHLTIQDQTQVPLYSDSSADHGSDLGSGTLFGAESESPFLSSIQAASISVKAGHEVDLIPEIKLQSSIQISPNGVTQSQSDHSHLKMINVKVIVPRLVIDSTGPPTSTGELRSLKRKSLHSLSNSFPYFKGQKLKRVHICKICRKIYLRCRYLKEHSKIDHEGKMQQGRSLTRKNVSSRDEFLEDHTSNHLEEPLQVVTHPPVLPNSIQDSDSRLMRED